MDFINDLLEFQINRLDYQFQNSNLLIEALTQQAEIYRNVDFPEKNQNYDNLCFVGEAVLKLVVCEYCVISTKIGTGQEITWLKSRLLEVSKQNEIGEKLVAASSDQGDHTFTMNNLKVRKIVRVAGSNLANPSFKMGYHKILKAVFGAVFIDAGGSKGIGLEKCLKLFLKLWKPFLEPKNVLKKLSICFPSPKREIHQFWLKNGVNLKFIRRMEEKFGVKFRNGDVLCEAVIQKSFYDLIRNDDVAGKLAQPDYERLEFLGDSVLGLVITEHVYNNHKNGKNVAEMVAIVTSLINDEYQAKIYAKLGIGEFVKMKRGRIPDWKKHGDLVESVVGAVFVDGGILKARKFVEKAFLLSIYPSIEKSDLRSLEYKLNYSFKNKQFLIEALMMTTAVEGTKISNLEKIGGSILSLFLVDYKTRTCDTKADEVFLQKICKPNIVIVSKPILHRIFVYLNIPGNVETLNDTDNLANESYEMSVVRVFGAIWRDLAEKNLYPWSILENVFYHVFNPYLLKSPKKSLLERKLNNDSTGNLRKITEYADKLQYKFGDPSILYILVNKSDELLQIKLELIGLHVIHLSSSLHIYNTELKRNTENLVIEKLMNKLKNKLSVKLFMEKLTGVTEDRLTPRLVGLMYADIKSKEGLLKTKIMQKEEDISWLLNFSL